MSHITITISGNHQTWKFSNDWDECARNGWLHIEDLAGWYGGVDATVTPEVNRFQSHGAFPAPSIRGPRKMDLVLSWHESIDDSGYGYQSSGRAASGIMWDKGPYTFTLKEDVKVLTCEVQLDGEIAHTPVIQGSEQAYRLKINLRASDPFLYGPEKQYTILTQGAYKALSYKGGLFGSGKKNAKGKRVLSYGTHAARTPPIVKNLGNATAYPVYTVTADSPNGVRLTVNGRVIDYRGPLFSQTPLVIDMAGSVSMRGKDVSQNLRLRNWSPLGPETNTTPTISFPGKGVGFAVCTVRDTWI